MDRKYYIYRVNPITYNRGLFSPTGEYMMLMYLENDKFYELLTGQYLGTYKDGDIFSDEFGWIRHYDVSHNQNYTLVTAEEFARKARTYMAEKSKIIPHINDRFEMWRSANKKRIKQEKAKLYAEEKKKAEDLQNVDWLSNLLDKRK